MLDIIRSYLGTLLGSRRWYIAVTLVLSALIALSDGLAILLLVPLLAGAGLFGNTAGEIEGTVFYHTLLEIVPSDFGVGALLILWVGVVAAHAGMGLWRDKRVAAVQIDLVHDCRTRLFRSIGQMEWSAFVSLRRSDLVHALTGLQGQIFLGTGQVMQASSQTLVVLTYLGIALAIEPMAGLLAVVSGLILVALQPQAYRRAIRESGGEIQKGRNVLAQASDYLAGMKVAKAWGAEARQAAGFEAASAELSAAMRTNASARATAQLRLRMTQAVTVAAGLWLCITWLELSGPSLLMLAAVPIRLLPVLGALLQAKRSIAEMLPAWAAYQAFLDSFNRSTEPIYASTHAPTGTINLAGVSFAWPGGSDRPAVKDISLELPEGSITVLAGPSGAGKSTLAGIILGLLAPPAGTVSVGGVLLEGGARRAWRGRTAYVPQDIHLLNDTVRANLAWACPDAGEDAMWRALADAAVDDVVGALPQGLDTPLGDNGSALSGGQGQRIAIAQALLRNPSLLVLDEATSQLDDENDSRVIEALERLRGQVTLVIVAHRQSSFRIADRVIWLYRGRIRTDQ